MYDSEVAENTDNHVVLTNVAYRRAAAYLHEEGRPVDQCAVRIGVTKIRREIGVEPGYVDLVNSADIVAIEIRQSGL